jgi:hypothetical protein
MKGGLGFESGVANGNKQQQTEGHKDILGPSQTELNSAKCKPAFPFRHPCSLFQCTPALAVENFSLYLRGTWWPGWFVFLLVWVPILGGTMVCTFLVLLKAKI